jgi:hypothetical protein
MLEDQLSLDFNTFTPESQTNLTLNDVKFFLCSIPDLHRGGCAISALAMKRWLKKFKGIESTIVYGFSRKNSDYSDNQRSLKENNKELTSACSHAGLKIEGSDLIFDAKSRWYKDEYKYYIDMPEEFVISSLEKMVWNNMFERSNVKIIAEKLDIDLSDVPMNIYK